MNSGIELAAVTMSASSGRSTICANANSQLSYVFKGRSAGATDLASFVVQTRYEVRSSLLDDASLINPLTGTPFNGRILFNLQSYFADQDYMAPQQRFARSQKLGSMDCGAPLLTYQMLTTTYGLSSLQAQRLLAGSITVRQFVSGAVMMLEGGNYGVQLRMIGD
jgi:hypothetical protein